MIALEVLTRDRGQQVTKGMSLVTSMSEELAQSALTTLRPDSPLEGRRSKIGDMVIDIAALPTVVTASSPPDSFVSEPVAESTDSTAGQKKRRFKDTEGTATAKHSKKKITTKKQEKRAPTVKERKDQAATAAAIQKRVLAGTFGDAKTDSEAQDHSMQKGVVDAEAMGENAVPLSRKLRSFDQSSTRRNTTMGPNNESSIMKGQSDAKSGLNRDPPSSAGNSSKETPATALVSRHGPKNEHSAHLGATPSQRETRASQRRKRYISPTGLV